MDRPASPRRSQLSALTLCTLLGGCCLLAIAASGRDARAQEPATAPTATPAAKARVAIADFAVTGDVGIADAGKAVSELLMTELDSTEFQIVERSMLDQLLKEKDLTLADVAKNPMLLKGKLEGVKYIVVGSVVKLGNLSISARMVDVNTGDVARAARVSAEDARGLQTALGELARKLGLSAAQPAKAASGNANAPLPKEVRLEVRCIPDGFIMGNGKKTPVGPKTPVVIEKFPNDCWMSFIYMTGKNAKEFFVDLTGNSQPLVQVVFHSPFGPPLKAEGMGVPEKRLRPAEGIFKWNGEIKESAAVAALADAVRHIGEAVVKESNIPLTKTDANGNIALGVNFHMNFIRVASHSHTYVDATTKKTTSQDRLKVQFALPDERPLDVEVNDFVPVRYPKDDAASPISKQIIDILAKRGFKATVTYSDKEFLATATVEAPEATVILRDK